ncbi:MAG: MotA/TolQ/ExbB proton channel family protein [Planctomycetaceae bacterium]|nr:MotA/TolQ/ExbB proton channel family protein [Planctomycetaceae bacterium]
MFSALILFAAEKAPVFDLSVVVDWIALFLYLLLALVAFWGTYSVILIWRRVSQLRFKDESEQIEFLAAIEPYLASNRTEELQQLCEEDPRALVQLTLVALKNKHLPTSKLRDLLIERFQRDISAELDYRGSWVQTIIKAAPMLGLYGTVVGMMGAFSKLSAVTQVSPDKLAGDISFALVTTAIGLTIAIPLILITAIINIRISKFEDLVGAGLTRLVEIFSRQ